MMDQKTLLFGGGLLLLLFLGRSKSAPPPGGLPGGPSEEEDLPAASSSTPKKKRSGGGRAKTPPKGGSSGPNNPSTPPTAETSEYQGMTLEELEDELKEVNGLLLQADERHSQLRTASKSLAVLPDGTAVSDAIASSEEDIMYYQDVAKVITNMIDTLRRRNDLEPLNAAKAAYKNSAKSEGIKVASARALKAYVKQGGSDPDKIATWQAKLGMNYYDPGVVDYATMSAVAKLTGEPWGQ